MGKDTEEEEYSFQVRPATWVTVAVLRFPDSCLGKHDTFDHAWLDTSLIDNGCAVFIDFAVMNISFFNDVKSRHVGPWSEITESQKRIRLQFRNIFQFIL